MKITIDLNKPFTDTDGNALAEANQNKFLAKLLAASPAGDALKQWDWAITLSKSGVLELDESDFQALEKFVKECKDATTLAKAQLLQALIDARLCK